MNNERFHTAYGLWFCRAACLLAYSGPFWLPGDHGEASTGHNCNAAVANVNSIASNRC